MKLKKILIIVGIIGIIASIGLNLFFGLLKAKEISYKQGLEDGANNAVQQIKNGIRINFEDGVILFVPKAQE